MRGDMAKKKVEATTKVCKQCGNEGLEGNYCQICGTKLEEIVNKMGIYVAFTDGSYFNKDDGKFISIEKFLNLLDEYTLQAKNRLKRSKEELKKINEESR
jgi:methionyl-tRNA synthetase